ncbi:MAG: hydroxymethylglutaryl-CoA lyase [Bacteroidota bacterium]|nr:hydroxymethylglutaryl-CoA lyase [Bacteroidota bacterium]
MEHVKIIECPRDAMQGIHDFIPTDLKIQYIQKLLAVGFDAIDFGSFVSSKAIPQMKDTRDVLEQLDISNTSSKLLAIIANLRGAQEASAFKEIDYLGYPFSVSETFQIRNTNATIIESFVRVQEIQDLILHQNKQLIIYISMAFGNPYGDIWNADEVLKWIEELKKIGIKKIALSDTIGVASPESIRYLFSNLIGKINDIEFSAHFHTLPHQWQEKIDAAFSSGCHRFDGAIKGYGGCPMAKDELTGNMATENLITYFKNKNIPTSIQMNQFDDAMNFTANIFNHYH